MIYSHVEGRRMTLYHVSLNGQGYVLDLDRYAKRIREPFARKQSTGSFALADLQGPEQVLVISDWSGGDGAVQHDEANPGRYRSGASLDGYSFPGALRLGPAGRIVGASIDEWLMMVPYASNLYVGSGLVGGQPRVWQSNLGGSVISHSATAARIPSCMAVYANRLYVGNSGDGTVASFDGTAWTAVAFTLAAGKASALATHFRQAASYLYVAAAFGGLNGSCRMVFWDGVSVSPAQFDMEEPECSVLVPWRHHLWMFSADSARRIGGIYSVDDSSTGGLWETHEVLTSNYFTAGCAFGDDIYLGTGVDGEIYRWDGTRLELVYRLATRATPYTVKILGMAASAGALWVSISDGTGTTGLLRYDGSSWSRPLRGLGGSGPRYLAPYGGMLALGTQQASGGGVLYFIDASIVVGTGQLESGLVSCGLPGVAKLFKSVTVVTSAIASPQTVQVEYRLEDTGGWTSLGTLSAVGATTATYAFAANTTGRQIAFRLTLSGTAAGTASPVLYELALRYVPRPTVTREWELAVILEGTAELPLVTLDGASDPLTGAQLTSALWTAAGVAGPVTLLDLDGVSYSVYVQDVREEIGKISQRKGYQRLGLVKLVEAA
jgi:hypothetical protein